MTEEKKLAIETEPEKRDTLPAGTYQYGEIRHENIRIGKRSTFTPRTGIKPNRKQRRAMQAAARKKGA